MVDLLPIFKKAYWSLAFLGVGYLGCIGLLLHPWIQTNAIYMNKLTLTYFSDLTLPEQFGFARGQVTPFYLTTLDNERIFAWHVLPLGLYSLHRDALASSPRGVSPKPLEAPGLKLLMADPEARLIIHFHGNAGTVGAAYRPSYLRSLSAANPTKIHVLAIDYRGFGLSSGVPSEPGLILDGLSAVRWAVAELGVSPERIALVGQSLGTAVTFGVAEHLATTQDTTLGAVVSIAGFSDLYEIVRTYRIGGVFPVLSPLRGYPRIQNYLIQYVREAWDSKERVAQLVRSCPGLNLVLIHATNDYEIPHSHIDTLFYAAVNATHGEETLEMDEVEGTKEITQFGDESTLGVWPSDMSGGRKIAMWRVRWGGHNQVVTSAGTSVIVAKALGL